MYLNYFKKLKPKRKKRKEVLKLQLQNLSHIICSPFLV